MPATIMDNRQVNNFSDMKRNAIQVSAPSRKYSL